MMLPDDGQCYVRGLECEKSILDPLWNGLLGLLF